MEYIVCLDNLRSLFNIGAIFRTCSFFGIKKVILLGYSGKTHDNTGEPLLHKNILKTSLGAEQDLEIIFLENNSDFFEFVKNNNLDIVSFEQQENSTPLRDWLPKNSSVLVFGNEVTGVSNEILEKSSVIIEIPRLGTHNSLNVEVVFGIAINHLT